METTKQETHCFFCRGDRRYPSIICLPMEICHDCARQIKLDLSTPAGKCLCGVNSQLVPVIVNGTKHAICQHHLPLSISRQLASQLTDMYDFINAPSIYGSFDNFLSIKKLGKEILSEFDYEKSVNLFIDTIQNFLNNKKLVQTPYYY